MLALVLVVLAAPRSTVTAPSKPSLPSRAAVFVTGSDEGAAAAAEAELTAALVEASVPMADVLEGYPAPAKDDTGEKLAKEAKQAYDDLDYEGSAGKWKEALAWLLKTPEAANPLLLADAHFFTGALAIQNGGKAQAKKAQEEFVRGLLLNPALTCDAQVYGADVKKAFDRATAEIAKLPSPKVTIDSSPPGATVSFRGKEAGRTPLAEGLSLPVGRHLLVFSRPGYETTGAFVDVTKEGGTARPELKIIGGYGEVRDAAAAVIGKGVGAKGSLPPGAKKLADVVRARFLVLSDGATAEAWDVEGGNRLVGLSIKAEALAETAKKIAGFIARPGPAGEVASAGASPGESAAEVTASGPVYTKWWFWTAVGVVAAGGATAAGVAAANNSGPRPFNVVLGIP